MTDIEEFVRKISFIDLHLPEEKQELIKKLGEILEFEQTKHKEGLEDIIKYPLGIENQEEEIECFNLEQNTRILFIEKLIKVVQELSTPQELEESSGENRNSPKPGPED